MASIDNSTNQPKQPRNQWFDLIKLVASFFVIVLHIESFVTHDTTSWGYYLGWYSVPFFITVSTWLFVTSRDSLVRGVFIRKMKRLLLPFLVWSAIGFLLHREVWTWQNIIKQLLTGTAVNAPLYYLPLLALTLSGVYVAERRISRGSWIYLGYCLLILLLELAGLEHYAELSLGPLAFFVSKGIELSKYSAGVLFLAGQPKIIENHSQVRLILALILFSANVVFDKMTSAPVGYVGATQFLAVLLLSVEARIVPNLPHGVWKVVAPLQKYAFGVYALHFLVVERLTSAIPLVTPLLVFLGCAGVCLLIDHASRRRLAWLVR